MKIVFLDRVLAHYGPEAKEARELLRVVVVRSLDHVWPQERTRTPAVEQPSTGAEDLLDKIIELSPKDDAQPHPGRKERA